MKRLVDERTDELTRSLLEAGRAHQPPSGNEAKLLLALGVGGSVGLFSSKAFAWLGSGAGKLTLVGVGVGIAGVAYTLASTPSASGGSASSGGNASAGTVLAGSTASGAAPAGASPSVASSTALPEHVISERAALQPRGEVTQGGAPLPSSTPSSAAAPSTTASSAVASASVILAADSLPEAPLERAPGSHRHAHGRRGRVAAKSQRTLAAVGAEAATPLDSAAATNGATEQGSGASSVRSDAVRSDAVRSDAVASDAAGSEPGKGPEAASSQPVAHVTRPGLESEVALVDAMRSALARGDGVALHRLIASYRGEFPHGQLQAEVAELAARPLPSAR